jgi:hypothetical protein
MQQVGLPGGERDAGELSAGEIQPGPGGGLVAEPERGPDEDLAGSATPGSFSSARSCPPATASRVGSTSDSRPHSSSASARNSATLVTDMVVSRAVPMRSDSSAKRSASASSPRQMCAQLLMPRAIAAA